MIKHIVFFRLKQNAPEVRAMIHEKLMALPALIPEIREYELGDNLIEGDSAYDMALISAFDSLDALESYKVHPAHQEVLEFLKDATSDIVRVDYEI